MKSYSDFVQFYEDIFPFRIKTFEFLNSYFQPEFKTVLDLGCGTGSYISRFTSIAEKAVGIDNDAEMINFAEKKYTEAEFHKMNVLDLEKLNGKFDLIYSIGNVVSHLSFEDQKKLAANLSEKINKNGIWIFQTVNWNSVLQKKYQKFNPITKEDKSLKFIREYRNISPEKVTFYLKLEENDEIVFEEEDDLYPFQAEKYIEIYSSSGFSLLDHFGNYEKQIYSDESPANIIVFQKS